MKNKIITDYLNYFVQLENPGYAVLLKGKWGSGKTFFIKQLLESWKEPDDESTIKINPIYVSLNGINKSSTINEKLKAKLSPILYSKAAKVGKEIFKGFLKTAIKIDLDINDDGKADGNISGTIDLLSMLDNNSKDISGKKILIFDDIERCKIPTDEIFGYINNFVEHTNCKIILIAEEEAISKKYSNKENEISYKDFKEKLIGRTFEVEINTSNAIDSFLKDNESISVEQRSIIEKIFSCSDIKNLRILKHSLMDYKRIIEECSKEYKSHPNFNFFSRDFLSYFLITSLEYKSGNHDIKHYQSIESFFNDDKKNSSKEISAKYDALLLEYSIQQSAHSLGINSIVNYIENGSLSDILEQLRKNSYFRNTEVKNWEKLWAWRHLQDNTFLKLKNSVWTEFIKGDINTTAEILHVAGIFLNLEKENLSIKKATQIKKISEKLLKKTVRNEKITVIERGSGFFNYSWGKQYQAIDNDEFKQLLSILESLILENQRLISKDYLTGIFHNLNDQNIKSIYTLLNESLPDFRDVYDRTSIFLSVNPKILSKKIKLLSNENIFHFTNFLHSRYYPEERYNNLTVQIYHQKELPFLRNLLKEVSKFSFKHKPIKTIHHKSLVNELEAIILKLDSFDFENYY